MNCIGFLFSIFLFFLTVAPASAELILEASLSAYTSSVEETDASPRIMASTKTVYDGAIACPSFIPFGTEVYTASRKYVCEDRLGKRLRERDGIDNIWHFDIWMESKEKALEFGRRSTLVIVYISDTVE